MEKISSEDDEPLSSVVLTPQEDARIALALLEVLQKRGENVLMDELIEAAGTDEWEVARVLDVLLSLDLVAIERQRGNSLRHSRAFAYRTGYALAKPLDLSKLSDEIAKAEESITRKVEGIKRLKKQLASSNASNEEDAALVSEYRASLTPRN